MMEYNRFLSVRINLKNGQDKKIEIAGQAKDINNENTHGLQKKHI